MPQNIGDNRVVVDGIARIRSEDAQRLSRYLVREGDIVYSRRGDVERRALIRSSEDGWLCGTGCLRVRVGSSLDPRYASYYLGHPSVRQWIVNHAIGATMPNLNTSILSALPFVLPPRFEQERIAKILSALDDKIELNRRINETLETIARTIFGHWFADKAETTAYVSASQMIHEGALAIGDGYRAKNSELSDHGLPFARAGDIAGIVVLSDKTQHLSPGSVALAGDKISRPGDVVITTKGTVGRIARVSSATRQFVYSPQLCYWRSLSPAFDPYVLFMWVCSAHFRQQLERVSNQTDMAPYVSLRDQRYFRVPRFPEFAQMAVSTQLRPLLELQAHNEVESQTLVSLRDTLLPKLLSGEIAEKEVAEVV